MTEYRVNPKALEKLAPSPPGPIHGLVDHYRAFYSCMVEAFGEPDKLETFPDDEIDGKLSTEWVFEGDDGSVWTVYDWKCTRLWARGLPTPAQFRKRNPLWIWHIGGSKDPGDFVEWLDRTLRAAMDAKYARTKAKARATRRLPMPSGPAKRYA